MLRSALALGNTAIIRNKSLFCLKSVSGEKPVTRGNKKYNSDHSGTINYFIDLYSNTDILLSQVIDYTDVYNWLMGKREQINYRERVFNEPGYSLFLEYIATQRESGKFEKLLKAYISDKFILCFQEENAILAVPIKRAILTKEIFNIKGVKVGFTEEQREALRRLMPYKIIELEELFT
jgi:hypothetical protein